MFPDLPEGTLRRVEFDSGTLELPLLRRDGSSLLLGDEGRTEHVALSSVRQVSSYRHMPGRGAATGALLVGALGGLLGGLVGGFVVGDCFECSEPRLAGVLLGGGLGAGLGALIGSPIGAAIHSWQPVYPALPWLRASAQVGYSHVLSGPGAGGGGPSFGGALHVLLTRRLAVGAEVARHAFGVRTGSFSARESLTLFQVGWAVRYGWALAALHPYVVAGVRLGGSSFLTKGGDYNLGGGVRWEWDARSRLSLELESRVHSVGNEARFVTLGGAAVLHF